jgi:signal transduction histidine kinase/ligand-binding sensor domain-containing protein
MCFCRRLFRAVVVAVGIAATIGAIGAEVLTDPPRFRHVTIRDGLSNNSVYCITQDSLGFMWFGTFAGLNRYDGHEIEVFLPEPGNPESIAGSVIFDVVPDTAGDVWVGTDGGGVNHYEIGTDTFRRIESEESGTAIPSEKVFSLGVAPGEVERGAAPLWIGSADSGVSVMTGDRLETFRAAATEGLFSDVIRAIAFDPQGTVWIGTQGGGLSWVDRSYRFHSVRQTGSVRDIFIDSNGETWVGTEESGLLRVVEREASVSLEPIVPGIIVRTIAEDVLGRLWVGTERSGVVIVYPNGETAEIRHDPDDQTSISSDFVRDIFVDRSGLVWIGTRGGGVNVHNPYATGFEPLVEGSGVAADLTDGYPTRRILEHSDGTIWIATDGEGIVRVHPDGAVSQLRVDGGAEPYIGSDHVYALAEAANGDVWIGSDGDGLERFDIRSQTLTRYSHDPADPRSLSSDVVWSILVDEAGTVWVGTEGGGVNRYDPETDAFHRFHNDPDRADSLQGSSVRALFQDSRGTIWIGTWDGGLSRMVDDDRFENFSRDVNDPTSLSDNSVNCVVEGLDGTLWIGTSGGGLNAFEPETETFRAIREIDGLTDNNVLGIVPDDNGFLWVTTANGLSRFDTKSEEITTFWDTDGLPNNEFTRNGFQRFRNGDIAVGTIEGAVRFDPETIKPSDFSPPIRITGFQLFNKTIDQSTTIDGLEHLKRNVIVSDSVNVFPGDTFIGFTFAALDYTNPEKNKYAVQLIGFDTEMRRLGDQNEYYYASVPPGHYTFQVMGTNSNGRWSGNPATIDLVVHPSFTQTWYFYTIVLAGVVGAVYAGARFRIARLNRYNLLLREYSHEVQNAREKERKAVARDVHDELGQLLTTLKMHIYWLSHNAAAGEEQRQARYDSMLGLVGVTLDWTKSLATRLRPAIIDNLSLSEAVEWLIGDVEKNSDIVIDRTIESTPEIVPEKANTIFRLIQELLTNVVRHAGASTASVHLYIDEGTMCITVSDDGVGVTKKELSDLRSYGIIGMRERVRNLDGSIAFNSDGNGTTVDICIPMGGLTNS